MKLFGDIIILAIHIMLEKVTERGKATENTY